MGYGYYLIVGLAVFLFAPILSPSAAALATKQNKSPILSKSKYFQHKNRFGTFQTRWIGTESAASKQKKSSSPPIVCIHGFGGNADQFRYNLPALSDELDTSTYAIDLLGYGYSDKPNPKEHEVNALYNFENWADQTADFLRSEVKEPAILVCNSVGGLVGLQTAVTNSELVKGVVLIDISLRLLHEKKTQPFVRPFVTLLQTVLRESFVGKTFFRQIAQPKPLQNILNQAYGATSSSFLSSKSTAPEVTDETVDLLLKPGLTEGAADVFLDFISYSGGPLPEDLLPKVECPVRILWGENDPWEPIEMGRKSFAHFPAVDDFVTLKGAGHCPMDQVPDAVNKEIIRYIQENNF